MPALLASYLNLPGPNMMLICGFGATVVLIALAMIIFRGMGKWKEARQIQKSSWRTFNKISKVKGLSKLEQNTLARLVRQARVDRPTRVLGAMTLFDKCVDRAVDTGTISDDEQAILDLVRDKLIRTTTKWDGRTNRRQFERAECPFEVQTSLVTKDALDEEMKSSYDEDDPKFKTTLEELATQVPPVGARVLDVSAGGVSLLAPDKDPVKPGDFLRLAPHDDTFPFQIEGMVARILGSEKMENQHQLVIHGAFLPYDQELRKQIIKLVYIVPEKPPSKARKRPKKKAKAGAKPRVQAGEVAHAAASEDVDGSEQPAGSEPADSEAAVSKTEEDASESVESSSADPS